MEDIGTHKKLAVLVSGTGSLLRAMIEQGLPISLVLADRECQGIEIARQAGIQTKIVDRTDFGTGASFDRVVFTKKITDILLGEGIEVVAMAGFMTLFSPGIFTRYEKRILNIHPSLLPKYKGEHAVRDALLSGDTVTGTTIHLATPLLDDGKILAQESVSIIEGDTVETLWERIKIVERRLYPATIKAYLETL